MLAGASHELRSPLARLRLLLELLRNDASATPERIDEAAEEIEDLDRLVEDLLLASRLEAADQPLAREEGDLLEIVAVEAARAGARVEGRPTVVAVDRRMVKSLVRNLLDNAARHAGAGEVVVGVEPLPGGVRGARVWVADSGPGVPEAERERIFEAFHSGSGPAAASGLGLGLFLVRQIAEAHGGSAVCRPREGGGTVFEVVLPAAGADG
jgi:signal transduction histidine kinase